MKYILTVCVILSFCFSASAKNTGEKTKESIKLSSVKVSLKSQKNVKEKFLQLNEEDNTGRKTGNEELEKQSEQNLYDTKSEGFKLAPEIYYFAGAAVLAAVIFFLFPDDEPPAKTFFIFCFPVPPN